MRHPTILRVGLVAFAMASPAPARGQVTPPASVFAETAAVRTPPGDEIVGGRSTSVPETVAVDRQWQQGGVTFQGVARAAASPGTTPHADAQGHVSGNGPGTVDAGVTIVYGFVVESNGPVAVPFVPVTVTMRGEASASPLGTASAGVSGPLGALSATVYADGPRWAGFAGTARHLIAPGTVLTFSLGAGGRVTGGNGTSEFQAVADPVLQVDPCFPAAADYRVVLNDDLFPAGFPLCRTDPPLFLAASPGVPVTFSVVCTDPGDTLTLETDGLPAGAITDPALPLMGASEVRSTFTWTPPTTGPTTVLFSAVDTAGQRGRASLRVDVSSAGANHAPVADAGPDRVVPPADGTTPVTLDGSASHDPDGESLTYEWWNGSALLTSGTTVPTLETTLAPGRHVLTLVTTDPAGQSACDTVAIDVGGGAATTTTTSTTLPPPAPPGTVSLPSRATSRGIALTCRLDDPAAHRGASCEATGFAEADPSTAVTRTVRRAFNRHGRARIVLRLNRAGRRLLRGASTLTVQVRTTIADGAGHAGERQGVTLVRRAR